MMLTATKQPPLMEDLRNHSQEQLAELRLLLMGCAPSRPECSFWLPGNARATR
jgi:hypothetical protein